MKFLSTPSARRATAPARVAGRPFDISIHALREEGDSYEYARRHRVKYFYPRPPRGGRLHPGAPLQRQGRISIHALREEGDLIQHG